MNELVKFEGSNAQPISSRQIAEATGKRHQLILSDIREMCKQAEVKIVVNEIPFTTDTQIVIVIEHEFEVDQGLNRIRKYKEYLLNPMATELLATGYDVKRRLAVLQLLWNVRNNLAVLINQIVETSIKKALEGKTMDPSLDALPDAYPGVFYIISEYLKIHNLKSEKCISLLGKECVSYSKVRKLPIRKVKSLAGPHRTVNAYLELVLSCVIIGTQRTKNKK